MMAKTGWEDILTRYEEAREWKIEWTELGKTNDKTNNRLSI